MTWAATKAGRVLLVDGVFGFEANVEPIGLSYAAAVLRERGFEVTVIDPTIDGLSVDQTLDAAGDLETYDLAGVSAMSIDDDQDLGHLRQFVAGLRERGFQGHVTAGGHGVSLRWRDALDWISGLDSVVVGEGEETLAELCESLTADEGGGGAHHDPGADGGGSDGGGSAGRRQIPGLAARVDGVAVWREGRRKIPDLDSLPFPARDSYARRVAKFGRGVVAAVLASRGCFHRCSFCSVGPYHDLTEGPMFRLRSVGNVVAEIDYLNRTYGADRFFFLDEHFVLPGPRGVERAQAFQSEVSRRGLKIRFHALTRVESVTLESIAPLKAAGLNSIFLGLESASEADLQLYQKRQTMTEVDRALEVLSRLGYGIEVDSEYRVRVGYIAFHPDTTVEALRDGLALARRFSVPIKKLVRPLEVFAGTDLYEEWPGLAVDPVAAGGQSVGGAAPRIAVHISGITYRPRFSFRRPEIAVLYREYTGLFNELYPVRERLRTVEKLGAGRAGIDLGPVQAWRKRLDDWFYEMLSDMVEVAATGPTASDRLIETAKRFRRAVLEWMDEAGVVAGLDSIGRAMGIAAWAWGMQWPTPGSG